MENTTMNRRRNYFIKKEFQRNFILKFCGLLVLGSLISGGVIYFMAKTTVTTTFENSRLVIKSTSDYILPSVLLSSAIVFVLVGLAVIAVTLFTSHRIAGPLYRLEKDIEEVSSGNLAKVIHLRKADEIKALAEDLNGMIASLRADIESIKSHAKALEEKLGTEAAKEELSAIKKIISKFST